MSDDTDATDATDAPKMKKCPFCAEDIRAEARKCKVCGEYLVERVFKKEEERAAPKAKPPVWPILFLILFAAFVLMAAKRRGDVAVFAPPPAGAKKEMRF